MLAVFVLRVRRPDAARPYRAWGYPVLPAIFVVFYLFLVIMLCQPAAQSSIGLLFILAGLIAYLLLAESRLTRRPPRIGQYPIMTAV